uniref:Homeobox and leucine zipper encoding n=1 Tax=Latimeria chalumnae TaxID=7897 RepID=H3BC08_LATCH
TMLTTPQALTFSANQASVLFLPLLSEDLKLIWTRIDEMNVLDAIGPLTEAFDKFPYPSESEMDALCQRCGLQVTKVKLWFAIRRVMFGISWSPGEVEKVRWKLAGKLGSFDAHPIISTEQTSFRILDDLPDTACRSSSWVSLLIGQWIAHRPTQHLWKKMLFHLHQPLLKAWAAGKPASKKLQKVQLNPMEIPSSRFLYQKVAWETMLQDKSRVGGSLELGKGVISGAWSTPDSSEHSSVTVFLPSSILNSSEDSPKASYQSSTPKSSRTSQGSVIDNVELLSSAGPLWNHQDAKPSLLKEEGALSPLFIPVVESVDQPCRTARSKAWKPSSGLQRRKSREQTKILKDYFQRCNYPTEADLHELEGLTGLSRKDITKWFYTARYRMNRSDPGCKTNVLIIPTHNGMSQESPMLYPTNPPERYHTTNRRLKKEDLEDLTSLNSLQVKDWLLTTQREKPAEVEVLLSEDDDSTE